MDDMIEKIRSTAKLFSLPEIYLQLKELLQDPDFTMAEVALLVGRDPGMAARFLRIVNSPYYRRAAKIETIGQAVSMMGSRQVHDIVLSASVTSAFDGIQINVMNMHRFWQQSIYRAMTARQLTKEIENVEIDRMFLIGLLADIGHLCIYQGIPDKAQQAISRARQEVRPLYLVEREMLGFDFAAVGALMMTEWHLPESLQLPIAFQMTPGKAGGFALEASLLHLASLLIEADLNNSDFAQGLYSVDAAVWELSGLTESQCLQARSTAADQYADVAEKIL